MLKSFVDKIKTKLHPWVYGCSCCMCSSNKPFLRRQKRMKLKRLLNKELKEKNDD